MWHWVRPTQVPAYGFSIGFERIVDLVDAAPATEKVAVLYDVDVPVADALSVARRLRAEQGIVVSPVRWSGNFAAQLTRLENAGFTGFRPLALGQNSTELPVPPPLGARPA